MLCKKGLFSSTQQIGHRGIQDDLLASVN